MFSVIKQWVIKTMMKGQTGVVRTLPKNDLIELNTQITAERFMRNGINPEDMKTVGQVENVINQIDAPKVKVNPGMTSVKKADVLDMEGNKIDTSKGIMGGKEVPTSIDQESFLSRVNKAVQENRESDAAIKARLDADNKKGIESMKKKLDDPEEKADGGRIGLFAGSTKIPGVILRLLKNKKKVNQAVNDIFPTGDYKYDAQMAADAIVENNPKTFKGMLYEDLDMDTQMEVYGAVIGPIQSNALSVSRMKKATRPEKTLSSMKEGKGINMSDPEIADEFARFMKETDPKGTKNIEEKILLESFDPKRTKGNADGGRIGLKGGTFLNFIKNIGKGMNNKSPLQAYKDYLKSVKDRAQKGDMKTLAPEMGIIAGGGILTNRFLKKKLEKMTEDVKAEVEKKADGGRIGLQGGGSDASTTSYSKSYDKQHGTNTASRANKSVDRRQAAGQRDADNTNSTMEANRQAGLSEIFAPKETIREKIENSRFNNPITRGLFRAGLYATNPSLGVLNARQAMQLKNAYDLAVTGSLPNTDTEETSGGGGGMTSNLITDTQKEVIDAQGNMGKLTGAFNPDDTFDAAKGVFNEETGTYGLDDKGEKNIFSADRPAEPMTREEFNAYVNEKGYADGGRIGLKSGMTKRAFMKLMGGVGASIGAAKSGIFSGFGKGATKQVAKEVAQQTTSGMPPPYFFKLAEKIKMMGDDVTATTDRTIAKSLKSKDGKSEYFLEEDMASGDTIIKKINKEGDEMVTDIEIMELKKGEVVQGKDGKPVRVPDEYEEVTEANARIEGDVFNDPYYSDGIKVDEIIKEVDDKVPSIKYASGGLAYMLGE